MTGRYDPRNISIESSGDAAADAAEIADHIRSSMLLDEGMCPNGCGPRDPGMPTDGGMLDGGSHCPACGFVTNVGVISPWWPG